MAKRASHGSVAKPTPPSKPRRPVPGIKSLEIGIKVLTSVARLPSAATLTEVARDAGLDLSTCRRYLVSLLNTGMVRQEERSGRYDLGDHLFLLGLRTLIRGDLIRSTIDGALALNRELDLTVLVSVWGDRGPTVIAWFDRSTKLICNSYIGSVYPILTTATGRVFLAYPPDDSVMQLAESELDAGGERDLTAKQRSEIDRLCKAVRAERLGSISDDLIPGLSAVAAPVFDCHGKIAAVIAVLAESRDLQGRARDRVVRALQATGDGISFSQGFGGPPDGPPSFAEWLEGIWGHTLSARTTVEPIRSKRPRAVG